MRNTTLLYTLLALWCLAGIASCSKEDQELTIINQEQAIDKYIESKYKDSTVVINDGSRRIVIEKGNPNKILEYGDSVYFYYAGTIFQNSGPSTLFATNVQEVAEAAGLILSSPDYNPVRMKYSKGCMIKGLELGFEGIAEREHSLIVFSARYGYGNDEVANIPKLSALMFEVWIEKIVKKQ